MSPATINGPTETSVKAAPGKAGLPPAVLESQHAAQRTRDRRPETTTRAQDPAVEVALSLPNTTTDRSNRPRAKDRSNPPSRRGRTVWVLRRTRSG